MNQQSDTQAALHSEIERMRLRTINTIMQFVSLMLIESNAGTYKNWLMSRFNLKVHFHTLLHSLRTFISIATDISTNNQLYNKSARHAVNIATHRQQLAFFQELAKCFKPDEAPIAYDLSNLEIVRVCAQLSSLSGLHAAAVLQLQPRILSNACFFETVNQPTQRDNDVLILSCKVPHSHLHYTNTVDADLSWLLDESPLIQHSTKNLLQNRLFTCP